TLVEDGVAKAEIVLSREATADERSAADELRRYVQKSSGVELPIRAQRTPGRSAVLVGLSVASAPLRARVARLERDGFVVEGSGETLVLAGNGRNGTSFAVYEFLERFVGVRWLWPGEVGEVVPRRKSLLVEDVSLVKEPAFVWRFLGPGGALWGPH